VRLLDIERLDIKRIDVKRRRHVMRHQPFAATPWEVEAARRREVVEADFGAPRTSRGNQAGMLKVNRGIPLRDAAPTACPTTDGLVRNT